MFLLACSAEAALLVAEDTNVEMTVVVTEVTFIYVRGLTSAGIDAFLSACPIVCCCSEGFLFLCLEVLVQGTASCVVSRKAMSDHRK